MQIAMKLTAGVVLSFIFFSIPMSGLAFLGDLIDGTGEVFDDVVDAGDSLIGDIGIGIGAVDLVDELDEPYIQELEASPPSDFTFNTQGKEGLAGKPADILLMRRGDVLVADIRLLEAYANQVLDKLKAVWTIQPVEARVVVTIAPDFSGHTLEHGTIFIPLGTFMQIESEDELAALLAHEISHVILGHHFKDDVDQTKKRVTDYAALGMKFMYSRNGEDATNKNYLKLNAARWLANNAFLPKWNRSQETAADVLGVDLALRAGYSADSMQTIIKKLEATSKKRHEVTQELSMDTGPNGLPQIDLESIIEKVKTAFTDEFGQNYEDAKERRKQLRSYLRKFYPDRDRPELRIDIYRNQLHKAEVARVIKIYDNSFKAMDKLSEGTDQELSKKALTQAAEMVKDSISKAPEYDPYLWMLMYDLRRLQGEQNSAYENAEVALKSNKASFSAYRASAVYRYRKQQYDRANHYISEVERIFDDSNALLDMKILIERKLGNKDRITLLKGRCVATAIDELIQRCNMAEKGDDSYYSGI